MFSDTAQVNQSVLSVFFVSFECLLFRVTMMDKKRGCHLLLLATSAIMLSEKKKINRKIWSEKWYLKRNISCNAYLLNSLHETNESAGKLRKLWDSMRELSSSVCEIRLERTVLRPALLPVKTAQFTKFFRQV
jgi:hypothetical protein